MQWDGEQQGVCGQDNVLRNTAVESLRRLVGTPTHIVRASSFGILRAQDPLIQRPKVGVLLDKVKTLLGE